MIILLLEVIFRATDWLDKTKLEKSKFNLNLKVME